MPGFPVHHQLPERTQFTEEKSEAASLPPAGPVAAQQAEALGAEGGSRLPADVGLQGGGRQPEEKPHPAAEPALHPGVPPGAQVPTPPTQAHPEDWTRGLRAQRGEVEAWACV